MKLLIAGSRTIENFDLSPYISDDVDLIISGGAKGADTIAEQYADKHRISKLIMYPKYNLYRRNAPLLRNKEMVKICDRVLILWDGKSTGTKHTIKYAKEEGKPLELIKIDI
jgi:predicted Rossmann fold nucleotide-binding protein DprA/Smf involved in DNA uptake